MLDTFPPEIRRCLYRFSEVRALTGLSTEDLRAAIASGRLVARKFQNRIVFVDDDLRRFLAALPHLSATPNEGTLQ